MDPNSTLAILRFENARLIEMFQEHERTGVYDFDLNDTAESVAEAVDALVSWLDKGGALPDAWKACR